MLCHMGVLVDFGDFSFKPLIVVFSFEPGQSERGGEVEVTVPASFAVLAGARYS